MSNNKISGSLPPSVDLDKRMEGELTGNILRSSDGLVYYRHGADAKRLSYILNSSSIGRVDAELIAKPATQKRQ